MLESVHRQRRPTAHAIQYVERHPSKEGLPAQEMELCSTNDSSPAHDRVACGLHQEETHDGI